MKSFYLLIFFISISYFTVAQDFKYSPPINFSPDSSAVNTFVNPAAAAVIQLTSGDKVDLYRFYKDFNKEELIEKGLELVVEDMRIVDEKMEYFYFKCKYTVPVEHNGQVTDFIRIIYFTQNADHLIMAVASFPQIVCDQIQKPIIESFSNIR